MNAEAILALLRGVRRTGGGWMARCPAHRDRSPSLSIREANGKILLHCFAGCNAEAVCSAIGIRLADLFSQSRKKRAPAPRIVHDAERQLVAGRLRSRLAPSDRERPVTVVLADRGNPDAAIARALALSVEGEIVQVAFAPEADAQ